MTEPPKRRWFRFSLRTLFVVVTVFAIWLGYHVNWIQERRVGRQWLEEHSPINMWPVGNMPSFPNSETKPPLPFGLRILGERPLLFALVRPKDSESLSRYRQRVAEMSRLFPECRILDYAATHLVFSHDRPALDPLVFEPRIGRLAQRAGVSGFDHGAGATGKQEKRALEVP